ncbi:MAG: SRPBCC family protein [Candidatus Rokuibacteriota bacterium]
MSRVLDLVRGMGIGVAVGYLFDPERGRRRRALARDKVVSSFHGAGGAFETTKRDVTHRTQGVIAGIRSRLSSGPVSDEVLVERVRAELGRAMSRPGAIVVSSVEGRVVLAGAVRADEVDRIVRRVARVRGVRGIENRLDPRAETSLGRPERGMRRGPALWEFSQARWSPTARLLAGVAGGTLGVAGLRRGGLVRAVLTATGGTLLARAVANLELRRLFGIGAGRDAVVIQKTLNVAAPVDEVFDFWSHYERFPRFMAHVREIRRGADGRSHWTVTGPGGVSMEWTTVETAREPDHLLAWKTIEGGPVAHSGRVQFRENPDRTTRIDIRMSYNPPAGAMGHAVASLLGFDPRRSMDDDLVRLKWLLEEGKTRGRAERVTRSEL